MLVIERSKKYYIMSTYLIKLYIRVAYKIFKSFANVVFFSLAFGVVKKCKPR
jgi:hypothetical protein